jgi:hypothetical protein
MDISVKNRAEAAPAPAQRGDYKPALMVLTSLFFMWGVLNDVTALAMSLPVIPAAQLTQIGGGAAVAGRSLADRWH